MKLALRKRARLVRRERTGRPLLLYPERALELSDSAAEIIELLAGSHSLDEIVAVLEARYPDEAPTRLRSCVERLIGELRARRLIELLP